MYECAIEDAYGSTPKKLCKLNLCIAPGTHLQRNQRTASCYMNTMQHCCNKE